MNVEYVKIYVYMYKAVQLELEIYNMPNTLVWHLACHLEKIILVQNSEGDTYRQ
jgi:hypothetical protein